jgi:polar amino acid transport system permease protein
MAYDFRWEVLLQYRDVLLHGLLVSLVVAAISQVTGSALGLVIALARVSGLRLLRILAASYVEAFRNIPLLLVIFFVYFGFAIYNFRLLDQFASLLLALSLYAGAYLSEVFRAGILSVERRYREAGQAIGLRPVQVTRHIVLPLMFAQALPALGNNVISLFKDSSLGSAIAVSELTFAAIVITQNTFRVFEAWIAVGGLYLLTSYVLSGALRLIERRVRRWA